MPEKAFAFVLMPFDREFDDVYTLGIKAAVEHAGMLAERVDEQVFHRERILERIYNQIDLSDFVIADMTGKNANVFYEVGYAHAKNKICILITKNASDIPFDLKHHRHITYSSLNELKYRLIQDLDHIKSELAGREQPIKVELKNITGSLEKTKYSATALITMRFDIHNRTNQVSPDIDSMYLYTGRGWTYKQDNQDCSTSDSDLGGQKIRHFIKPPVTRVSKRGWVPLNLIGTKVVGSALKGEELKDSYDLAGYVIIRVRTAKGDFDSKIELKVTADEISF